MKFKKIGTKMLVTILPIIILSMVTMTSISVYTSKTIIDDEIQNYMASEIRAQLGVMSEDMEVIRNTADNLSKMIANSYKKTDLSTYEAILKEVIASNEIISGSGIWFEPYVYYDIKKYVGSYVYRDQDEIAVTYDYSSASYDYLTQDYYVMAKESNAVIITEPYYDPTSGVTMSSCSAPIYAQGTFIGCVTVDLTLDTLQTLVNNISVGEKGTAFLLGSAGTYMAGVDNEKISTYANILRDDNSSLAKAGEEIIVSEAGMTSYQDSQTYNLYYGTLPQLGWKLVIQIPRSELTQRVDVLTTKLAIICVVAVILAAILVLLQVKSISKTLKKVVLLSSALAKGDFTVKPLEIKSKDELGNMGTALNDMYASNKDVISTMAEHSVQISSSSKELYKSTEELIRQVEGINNYMAQVNEAMMSSSAATEEVNASAEEVNASINLLSGEIAKTKEMADEIRSRADEVGATSQTSYDNAISLSDTFHKKLTASIENAKVVENIGSMANVISDIASQINLLSLNASIEAARAGEHGRGFAVVATEIGSLANATSDAVGKIQTTISDVKQAFDQLTSEAAGLLDFVQKTVTPDYNSFVGIASQYRNDAEKIEDSSTQISEMAANITTIMSEVNDAIQNISESAQATADNSAKILKSMEEVSGVVDNVSDMSEKQENIADTLEKVVNRFTLN